MSPAWREDGTRDCWGQFCYIRDLTDQQVWSAGFQPSGRAADEYTGELQAQGAEFRRLDGEIETRWQVCVAPGADAEARALTLVNRSKWSRELELTSYAEVCLNNRRADRAHPAFAKLFLETKSDQATGALLARVAPGAPGRGRSGAFTSPCQARQQAERSITRPIR
jgi:cellobiose phosphorylase